jgi:hypothetical protein
MKRTTSAENKTLVLEPTAADSDFAIDVVAGLSAIERTLPPKYFYDASGSELFEAISRTPEYYPTRVETALLQRAVAYRKRAQVYDQILCRSRRAGGSVGEPRVGQHGATICHLQPHPTELEPISPQPQEQLAP